MKDFFDSYLLDEMLPMRRVWRALMYTMIVLMVAAMAAAWGWKIGERLSHVEGHGALSTEALAHRADIGW